MMRTSILGLCFLVLLPFAARSQPGGGAEDTIRYHDRKKNSVEVKTGTFKETAAGVEITVAGKPVVISPADVISITYGKLAGVDDKVRQELGALDRATPEDALAKFSEALKNASAADDRSKRFLEFKTAMASAKLADMKSGEEFKAEAKAAVDRLNTVARSYNKSWEVWPASRACARLQAELGKYTDAAATLATLAKVEGLPPELKAEAKLAEADVLFRSGIALSAEPAIEALGKVSDLTSVQKERVAVFQAALKGAKDKTDAAKVQAAAKVVQDLIDKMGDPAAKAAAHNVLGELFLMANLPQDAKWQFCWVEAVHNQDRDEVVKALARLGELFEKQEKKDQAAVYREKLLKAKGS